MFTKFKRLTWKASLLATVVSVLGFTIALAASGDLDTTFSGDGKTIDFAVPSNPARSDTATGVAIQSDGKIVVAGYSYVPSTATNDFAVLRYTTGGVLDTAFSGDGRLITNFGGRDTASDVAIQSNGKIVVSGQVCLAPDTIGTCDLALARYNPGGALDTTFSGDGKLTMDFGGDDNGSFGDLAIQSNGRIVVVGYMWNGTDYDFAVHRYLSDGSPDTSFSGDGMISIGFGAGRQDDASGVAIQSDGKIVVLGMTGDASYANYNFAIARLNPNGSLDTTFSGDGKQITNFGGDDIGNSVALQTDGKIVAVGAKVSATLDYFTVARYNTNGSLDTTFNGSGKKTFSVVPSVNSSARDVLVQADGKIVIMGSAGSSGSYNFALTRLNSTGAFDPTFSGDGKVTVDFGGDDVGSAFAVQSSDGKYVLGGSAYDGSQWDFALARVLP